MLAFSRPDCDRRPCLLGVMPGSGRPREVVPAPLLRGRRPQGVRGLVRLGGPTAGGELHPAPKAMNSFSCLSMLPLPRATRQLAHHFRLARVAGCGRDLMRATR